MKNETLEARFQNAKDFANTYRKVLVRIMNGEEFKKAPKEVQENIKGSVEHFRRFNLSSANHPWTDEEKEEVIEMVTELAVNIMEDLLPKGGS